MNLNVILVEFNTAERATKYIENLMKIDSLKHFDVSIAVINNGSSDNFDCIDSFFLNTYSQFDINISLANTEIKQFKCYNINNYMKLYLLDSYDNFGFAKGNNLGVNFIKSVMNSDGYILFSNTDIIIPKDFDFLELCGLFKDNIALIGTRVLGLDNKIQSPYKYLNIYKRWIIPNIFWPFNKIFCPNLDNDLYEMSDSGICYRVMGSFFVMPLYIFEKINGFDNNTFLYAEEMILSEKICSIGMNTYYYNNQYVVHEHSVSIQKLYSDIEKKKLRFQSELYYYETYKKCSNITITFAKIAFNFYTFKASILNYITNKIKWRV